MPDEDGGLTPDDIRAERGLERPSRDGEDREPQKVRSAASKRQRPKKRLEQVKVVSAAPADFESAVQSWLSERTEFVIHYREHLIDDQNGTMYGIFYYTEG